MKIEPGYGKPVIHVKDASKSVAVVSSLLSKDNRKITSVEIKEDYEALRTIMQVREKILNT